LATDSEALNDLLLITPPFTQLNTPYPATAYLKGFLNTKHISSFQMDLGIEVILEIFSKSGLQNVFEVAEAYQSHSENGERILAMRDKYVSLIDGVVEFLQGKRPTFARQLASDGFLPQASRFDQLDDMDWAFGAMGLQDKAKHYATLFLEDLSDLIVECVDPHFGFSRYADRLGMSANSFDELYETLGGEPTFVDKITMELLASSMEAIQPKLVCFSAPFPGNLYSAFRCGQWIKANFPRVHIAMGGGFANTELRSLKDPRVFEFFDFITLDDGERPIELLARHTLGAGNTRASLLKRTFTLVQGEVAFIDNSPLPDYPQSECGTPDYSDFDLSAYISVIEIANPMHSLWSDGRWNKLTMAHGCYWGKCTFCDTSLDYIRRYEPIAAKMLVDRMEAMIEQTGENGFHFVDEAAPPKLMRELALEILKRKLTVTWWTNIRFEKSFTADLCQLLRASGCIAVSGGLEVASDRLLKLIDKGVTVKQVAQVTRNFTDSNILVHAYLMFGYPTQTEQETVDSLEMVRQLFELGIIQSGFWHRFALTAHSPVGLDPQAFGIIPQYNEIKFANNDIQYIDITGINHERFGQGLKKSLFNFMHGVGFDAALQSWFDFPIPHPTVNSTYIENCLSEIGPDASQNTRMLWLGNLPILIDGGEPETKTLRFHSNREILELEVQEQYADWLLRILPKIDPNSEIKWSFRAFRADFEQELTDFDGFWNSEEMLELRDWGLVGV